MTLRFRRLLCIVLTAFLCASCAAPRAQWTPETVAPPASLAEALKKVDRANASGTATLPEDRAATLSLTRDGAILTALSRNRSLAVERFGPSIASTRVDEARAAFDPRLLATISHGKDPRLQEQAPEREILAEMEIREYLPTGTEVFLSGSDIKNTRTTNWDHTGVWAVGVRQSLLRAFGPDVNLVDLRQARNEAAIGWHVLRGFVLELARRSETAYWEVVLSRQVLEIRRQAVELAAEQLRVNEDFIDVGKLAPNARVFAQSELAARQADLIDARADLRTSRVELIRLLNPVSENQWDLVLDPVDPPDVAGLEMEPGRSAALADLFRPELAESRLRLANRELETIRTRNGLLPDLTAFASFGRYIHGEGPSNRYQVGLSFEKAILNRAEAARDRRARFEQEQAEAALANLEQVIGAEVRQAAIEVDRQWGRIRATRQEVASRREELRVEEEMFRGGLSNNLDVFQVQEDLIDAQVDAIEARVRYIQSLTELYYKEGTLLPRRGIGAEP